jgi:hypothetical protein
MHKVRGEPRLCDSATPIATSSFPPLQRVTPTGREPGVNWPPQLSAANASCSNAVSRWPSGRNAATPNIEGPTSCGRMLSAIRAPEGDIANEPSLEGISVAPPVP